LNELQIILKECKLIFPSKISKSIDLLDAKDLIQGLLKVNPKLRLSIPEILNHKWLKEDQNKNNMQLNEILLGKFECQNSALNYHCKEIRQEIETININKLFFKNDNNIKLSCNDFNLISDDFDSRHIDNNVFKSVIAMGYGERELRESLEKNEMNQATVCYNLLKMN